MADELGLAILYGILSVVILNVGFGFQKYGLTPSFFEKIASSNVRKIVRSTVWLIGAVMTFVSAYFSLWTLATGSVSLIAALGGIGLVALALFSFFILKERINRVMLIGMTLIGVGSTIFGFLTVASVGVYINVEGLIAFIVVTLGFSLVIALYSVKHGYRHGGVILGAVSGLAAGIGVTLEKCSVASGSVNLQLLYNMFFYAWVIASVVSFLVAQLAFIKATAITVVPSYNSATLVLPQIGAMLVFAEYLDLVQWLAIVLLIIGIVLLTRFKVEPPKEPKVSRRRVPPEEDRPAWLSNRRDEAHN
nr:hypothetical protein [Candidatus Njordarchaeum guaymaensis]